MFQICILDNNSETHKWYEKILGLADCQPNFFETLDDLCLFLEEAHCSIAIVTAESLANADGVSALRKIAPALGVICMTEGCEASERLPLLESGADYCVDRHGNPRELVSVVANLLRRLRRFTKLPSGFAEEGGQAAWRLINDGWSLSSPECLETGLTIKERQILMCLFDKAGEIVSREELVRALGEDVYNYDYSGLDALISRLRKKIAEQGLTFPLRTVRGKGFLLMPQSERNLLP